MQNIFLFQRAPLQHEYRNKNCCAKALDMPWILLDFTCLLIELVLFKFLVKIVPILSNYLNYLSRPWYLSKYPYMYSKNLNFWTLWGWMFWWFTRMGCKSGTFHYMLRIFYLVLEYLPWKIATMITWVTGAYFYFYWFQPWPMKFLLQFFFHFSHGCICICIEVFVNLKQFD